MTEIDDKIIHITSGPVKGVKVAGVLGYMGIPYAAPPVGNLRWKPPLLPEPWKEIREMSKFGSACPQSSLSAAADIGPMSEDCLTLNVWTQGQDKTDKLPVMMFLHGGGFTRGGGITPLCNEPYLASKGVVLVTINYRLGGFGFLAHPSLTAESPYHASGNYGLMDQVMALTWIRDNIRQFGGDPGNVTVFGQSAGGASIVALMASPLARGLFHKAIVQSSGYFPPFLRKLNEVSRGMESMESIGLRFAEKLGARGENNILEDMRAKPWQEVVTAWEDASLKRISSIGLYGIWMMNHIITDGYLLPQSPGETFRQGKQYNIPLMTGATANEGTILPYLMRIFTAERYRTYVERAFGTMSGKVLEAYPPVPDDAQVPKMVGELFGSTFTCGTRALAGWMSGIQPDTYLYRFCYPPRIFLFLLPGMKNLKDWEAEFGCYHGSELPYLFHFLPGSKFTEEDKEFSDEMIGYWTRFARSGNPNGNGAQLWPAFESNQQKYLVLDKHTGISHEFDKKTCSLFAELEAGN
jgi:para-nitrobenzyl esterase